MKRNIQYPVDEIRSMIGRGMTQAEIAKQLHSVDRRITPKSIYKVCRRHGIQCQRTGPRSGPGHPEWKGGRLIDRNGYVHLWAPDHPECQRVNNARREKANGKYYRKEKYIQEHRLVMERHLGRHLLPTEVVHHVNGNRQDNRIENLELFDSNSRHLAETLKGNCPKWTPVGLARMRASKLLTCFPELKQCTFQALAHLLLSIQRELGLDAPPSKIEFAHWIASRKITAQHACDMALELERQQTAR